MAAVPVVAGMYIDSNRTDYLSLINGKGARNRCLKKISEVNIMQNDMVVSGNKGVKKNGRNYLKTG